MEANARALPDEGDELRQDFLNRLRSFKKASGLSRSAFAYAIGVDGK